MATEVAGRLRELQATNEAGERRREVRSLTQGGGDGGRLSMGAGEWGPGTVARRERGAATCGMRREAVQGRGWLGIGGWRDRGAARRALRREGEGRNSQERLRVCPGEGQGRAAAPRIARAAGLRVAARPPLSSLPCSPAGGPPFPCAPPGLQVVLKEIAFSRLLLPFQCALCPSWPAQVVLKEIAFSLDDWTTLVRKEKAVYHTLNKLSMDVTSKVRSRLPAEAATSGRARRVAAPAGRFAGPEELSSRGRRVPSLPRRRALPPLLSPPPLLLWLL